MLSFSVKESSVEDDQLRKEITSNRPPEAPLSIASVDIKGSGSICRLSPECAASALPISQYRWGSLI